MLLQPTMVLVVVDTSQMYTIAAKQITYASDRMIFNKVLISSEKNFLKDKMR
jgi:hypothetical protein